MNVGLLSTLAGIRSGPGTSAPRPEPAQGGETFMNALMDALGLAARSARAEGTPTVDGESGELQALLSMLAESSDFELDGDLSPGAADGESTAGNAPFGMADGTSGGSALRGFLTDFDQGLGRPSTGASWAHPTATAIAVAQSPTRQTATSVNALDATSVQGVETGEGVEAADPGSALSGAVSGVAPSGASSADASDVDGSGSSASDPAIPDPAISDPGFSDSALSDDPVGRASEVALAGGVADAAGMPSDDMARDAAEGVSAASASGASSAMAAALPVTAADPSLDKLAPALREKVERVIERMSDEFGHEVTVVEGYRSPDRQAHLYEQGRSRPGQVVTWTRQSWHSEGLAADLMVDGTYDNPLAYARLQRVAREEGLKTLGSLDMGHVELPGSADEPAPQVVASGRRFVGVAQPAPTAAVAAVAAVATPGQWVTDVPAEPAAQGVPAEVDVVADAPSQSDHEVPRTVEPTARSDFGSRLADAASTQGATSRGGASVTATVEAGAAEQAARIQEMRAMTEAAQPSRVSVRLDGGDQVRVGLLDRTVDASLDISDPDRAASIRSRVAELHAQLESRGLDLGALSLNGTTGSTANSSWLGGAGDPASEIIRTLLGGGAGEQGSDGRGSERTFAEERTRNQGGSDSNRSRRDAEQERDE